MHVEVSKEPYDNHLVITTHNDYAMETGIQVLNFLSRQKNIAVQNNGWQNGFGIEVAVWHPIIRYQDLTIEIQTDGEFFEFRRASGKRQDFNSIMELVIDYINHEYAERNSA